MNPVDVAIVGGGPAGMSAALWCAELNLESILIEREPILGGQLGHIYNPIENYLGLTSANGTEMLSHFEKSLASRNFVRRIGIKATSIDVRTREVHLANRGETEEKLSCKAVILAMGVSRRRLDIPGEIEFRGKGIIESGSRDKLQVSGKRVLIIGGGDAAFENALILSEFAASVRIAYRRNEPSARQEFVASANSRENIGHLASTVVTAIAGDSSVKNVELRDNAGHPRIEPVDVILIRIGVEPNSELAAGSVDLDESRYINVNYCGETSAAGIYAVGDIAHKYSPTLSTAAGTAATAVKAIFHSIKKTKEL